MDTRLKVRKINSKIKAIGSIIIGQTVEDGQYHHNTEKIVSGTITLPKGHKYILKTQAEIYNSTTGGWCELAFGDDNVDYQWGTRVTVLNEVIKCLHISPTAYVDTTNDNTDRTVTLTRIMSNNGTAYWAFLPFVAIQLS